MMPSWSSEICNSASDTSIPRLSTPRIVPTPSVMFLPGMNVPGGENTPFMPVRALGAPHTTWIGSPLPASTRQTRRRSAFGCCFASTTRAMTNGASVFALSSMPSTSSPTMVSLSASAASGASVSRCSLSQASVNFIAQSHRPLRAQSGRQCGKVQRAKAIVGEPAHIRLEERPQVRHAVFEHGDPVDPQAPGEALVFVRIEPAIVQHGGMDHAAAEDFHPILARAEADLVLLAPALDVDLQRGLSEREERRAETHLHLVDLEEGLAELFQDPLQVPEMRLPVDHQTLDLVKHWRVGLIGIAAVGAPGNDHADRRLLLEHGADLHRRRMGAQQAPRAVGLGVEIERVVHLPRRMAFREIEHGEIVVF